MVIMLLIVLLAITVFFSYTSISQELLVIVGMTIFVALFIALCLLPIKIMKVESEIRQYHSTKETIEQARQNKDISDAELAAMQHKVIEVNGWLSRNQYWNESFWVGAYFPNELKDLKPLK